MVDEKTFKSNKFLVLLSLLGLFLLVALVTVQILGVPETPLKRNQVGITFGSELVSVIFWSIFLLIGGFFWSHTFFRMPTIVQTIFTSFSLGLFVLISIIFLSWSFDTLQPNEIFPFIIMAFSAFVFLGLLLLIAREIIAVTFFSKK